MNKIDSTKLTIYTANFCVWCRLAKKFLKANKVEFEEKNIDLKNDYREQLLSKAGKMVVPVIEVGSEVVIGFDRKKLEKIMGISND